MPFLPSSSCMLCQDMPHLLSYHPKKMGAIFPREGLSLKNAPVGRVNKLRSLQSGIWQLTPHIAVRDSSGWFLRLPRRTTKECQSHARHDLFYEWPFQKPHSPQLQPTVVGKAGPGGTNPRPDLPQANRRLKIQGNDDLCDPQKLHPPIKPSAPLFRRIA